MTEKMPFNPGDVAKQIVDGGVVHLGDCIVMFKRLDNLVLQCRRCVLEQVQRFTMVTLIEDTERISQFIFKHQHKEPAS